MSSYYERKILQVLKKHKDGLTTINVAEKADISKTTALKYLASLRAAGKIDFMEVGPAKLWRIKSPEKRRKKSIPVSRTGKIESILNEFKEAIGLEGSAVVDSEGLTISTDLPWNMNPEKIGSLISRLLRIGMKSVEMTGMEPLEGIIVEGAKGKIVARSEGKVLLVAFCRPDTPLGTVKFEIEDFVKKINEILT